MKNDSFENNLSKKADEFKILPREGMWDAIAQNLPPEKSNNRKVLWLWWTLSTAAVSVIAFVLFYNFNSNPKPALVNNLPLDSNTSIALSNDSISTSSDKKSIEQLSQIELSSNLKTRSSNSNVHRQSGQVNGGNNPQSKSLNSDVKPFNQSLVETSNTTLVESHNLSTARTALSISDRILYKDRLIPMSPFKFNFQLPFTNLIALQMKNQALKPKIDFIEGKFWFVQVDLNAFNNNTLLKLDKNYQNIEPYQSTFESRKSSDQSKVANGFGLNFGLSFNRFDFSVGLKSHAVKYNLFVSNINSGIVSAYTNTRNFDYGASDSFSVLPENSGFQGAGGYLSAHYKFISIPLRVAYKLKLNRYSYIKFQPEIAWNYLKEYNGIVSTEQSGVYVKPELSKPNQLTKTHFSGGGNLMYQVQLNRLFVLGAGVNYSQSLQAIEMGKVSTFYKQTGVTFSLQYNIGRNE